jgi:hypothetical protein
MDYIVKQGDHLSRLAERFGFANFETIWLDPDNAPLRQLRREPNLLFPGDIVVIREKIQGSAAADTGGRHTFFVDTRPLHLRLRLLDFLGRPLDGKAVDVVIGSSRVALSTDGEGKVARIIPRSATEGRIEVNTAAASLLIGFLDPITERSGVLARLVNMGYLLDPSGDPDPGELELALEEFQADNGLNPSGQLDEQSRSALLDAYGC